MWDFFSALVVLQGTFVVNNVNRGLKIFYY